MRSERAGNNTTAVYRITNPNRTFGSLQWVSNREDGRQYSRGR